MAKNKTMAKETNFKRVAFVLRDAAFNWTALDMPSDAADEIIKLFKDKKMPPIIYGSIVGDDGNVVKKYIYSDMVIGLEVRALGARS